MSALALPKTSLATLFSARTTVLHCCVIALLAGCGANESDEGRTTQPNQAVVAPTQNDNSPEKLVEQAMERLAAPGKISEKAGAPSGPQVFADVLDEDEVLSSIQVCAGGLVDSLQITTNKKVFPKQGGPGGACTNVAFNSGEQILRVWGTASDAINSIGFDTTQGRKLGPWGNSAAGSPYTMTVYGGMSARFHGWRGIVGVVSGYTVISQLSVLQQGMGGAGGAPFIDRLQDDERLTSIRTCWRPNGYVVSTQMTTNLATRALRGGVAADQQCNVSVLEADEYLTEIFGRANTYLDAVGYRTNKGKTFGPFGGPGGNGFSQSLGHAVRFYGIYGRSGSWMDSIGFIEPMSNPDSNYLGFKDNLPAGKAINALEVCTGDYYGFNVVRSLQAFYDNAVALPRHGARTSVGLNCNRLTLNANETIIEMSGRTGGAVDQVKFRTNQGRQFGPFGGDGGRPFTIQNPWPVFLGFAGNASQAGNADKGTVYSVDFAVPSSFAPVASPDANSSSQGWWAAPANWPIIGIHSAVMADGRVMSYGTDLSGSQGAQFVYDVWDPKKGFGVDAHLTLPNTLGTDMFCSGQSLLPSGKLLLAGGDMRDAGYNRGTKTTTLFDPSANRLDTAGALTQARWYNSQKVLSNGQVITLGGYNENGAPSVTPEVFDGTRWKSLTGASDQNVFNGNYIRAFVTRSSYAGGRALWIIATNGDGTFNGKIYRLEVDANNGTGQIIDSGVRLPSYYSWDRPIVQISVNQVLVQLNDGTTKIINLPNNGVLSDKPSITDAGTMSQPRPWSEMLVLPTGDVLAVNGSRDSNQLVDVAYHAEIWSRSSRAWRKLASQLRPRLYHSTSLLLTDGRVISIGGGAPSPTLELNAQSFSPPYLFQSNGSASPRPTVTPASSYLRYGSQVSLAVSGGATRATLVRLSATTHSYNSEQMYLGLTLVSNTNNQMVVRVPTQSGQVPEGFYMLTVVNSAGVPSESKVVRIGG
jgi:hypothetical protein